MKRHRLEPPYLRAEVLEVLRERYPSDPEDVRAYIADNTFEGAVLALGIALRNVGYAIMEVVGLGGGWRL